MMAESPALEFGSSGGVVGSGLVSGRAMRCAASRTASISFWGDFSSGSLESLVGGGLGESGSSGVGGDSPIGFTVISF